MDNNNFETTNFVKSIIDNVLNKLDDDEITSFDKDKFINLLYDELNSHLNKFKSNISDSELDYLAKAFNLTKMKNYLGPKSIYIQKQNKIDISDCGNKDHVINPIIKYIESDVDMNFCFSSNEIFQMREIPINMYTGNLLEEKFYSSLFSSMNEYNEIGKEIYEKTKYQLENDKYSTYQKEYLDKGEKLTISKEATDWLTDYTYIFMNAYPYFLIPPKVRMEFRYFRNDKVPELYRGINFWIK
jgi:hypothetical protein